MADRYYVTGGSGGWNNTDNWSTSSGGASGASVPGSGDVAIFDANSNSCAIDTSVSVSGITVDAAYPGTISQGANTITISGTFSVAGGTFTGGSGTITTAALVLSSGTFTSTSGTLYLSRTTIGTAWNYTGGTFNDNGGTVRVSADGTFDLTLTGSVTLNNLIVENTKVDGTGVCQLYMTGTTWTVNGSLQFLGPSKFIWKDGTIDSKGSIAISTAIASGDHLKQGTGKLKITGTTAQTITATGSTATFQFIEINKPSGNVTATGDFQVRGDFKNLGTGNFIHSSGTYRIGTNYGTTSYMTVIAGDLFNNVISGGDSSFAMNVSITGTLAVEGNFELSAQPGGWNFALAGALQVKGDVTIAAVTGGGTATITFVGSGDQTYTDNGGTKLSGTVTINKTGGKVTLASNGTFNTAGQDLVCTAGTLDLAGYNMTVNDTWTIASGFTLKCKGNETLTAGTKTFNANATLEYYDAAVTAVVSNYGTTLPNVKFFGGKTHNFTAAGTFTSVGTWEVSGGVGKAILRSTTPATRWNLNFTGTNNLGANVDVQDGDATPGNTMTVIGSTDSGNNIEWLFSTGDGGDDGRMVSRTAKRIMPRIVKRF